MEVRILRASLIASLLLAVIGWGAFFLKPTASAKVEKQIVYQDRIEYRDRVVNRDIVKTVTRPDGTKVVVETKEHSTTKTETRETVKSSSTALPLPRYSLGLAVERPASLIFREPLDYRAELGYRITEHLWTTTSLTLNDKGKVKAASVGLRLEF